MSDIPIVVTRIENIKTYSASSTFRDKTFRATASGSSARAVSAIVPKIQKQFPNITHVEVDGWRMPVSKS